ncbi:hypothetical protein Fmac_005422 [Flemingia macrophylla]|uniref:Uncharacterized protein n=1 Tax=Flemingia macrophylla TaxID=520843 RepID=A0ABD1N7Q6_9FABA
MLGVYCHNGEYESVLRLVREWRFMDVYSFGMILQACSGSAVKRQGKEVHCKYVRKGGWRDVDSCWSLECDNFVDRHTSLKWVTRVVQD